MSTEGPLSDFLHENVAVPLEQLNKYAAKRHRMLAAHWELIAAMSVVHTAI